MSPAFAGPALLALAALLSSLGGAGFALAAPVHPLAVNAVRCLTAAGVSAVFFAADRRLPGCASPPPGAGSVWPSPPSFSPWRPPWQEPAPPPCC